jgi:hypothetical protein
MKNKKITAIILMLAFLPLTSYAHEVEIVEIQGAPQDWTGMVFFDDEEIFVSIDRADKTIYLELESGENILLSPDGIFAPEGIMDVVCDLLFTLCQKLHFLPDKIVCLIAVYLDCIMR